MQPGATPHGSTPTRQPLFPKIGVIDPGDLQEYLLTLILRVSAYLGLAVYVPSVWLGVRQGLFGLVAVDTIALVVVFGLYRARGLSFLVRATSVCLIYFSLGIGLLISVGPISQIYLFGFSIVAVLLFGMRVGLAAAALSSFSLLAVGVFGHASAAMTGPGMTNDVTSWLVITINFALVNILLTLAVGTVLRAVGSALSAAVAKGVSLHGQRNILRTLVDTLPDVVFTKDTDGRFVTCNHAALALFGAAREEDVAGKTVFDLFPAALAAPYHVDDLAVLGGAAVVNREERSISAAGNVVWYLTDKAPLHDASGDIVGLIGVSRDISAHKRADADRARLLSELQHQIRSMPLAYILTDEHLSYTRWNPAAERMFGYTEAEVLGRHPFDVIVLPDSTSSVASVLASLRDGTFATRTASEHRTKSGDIVSCEWHHTLMHDEHGGFAGLLSLGEDVTERKVLEGQLRQSQKMEAVGKLAGGIAHDFNNLLSVILGYSALLLDDFDGDASRRADVEEIQRAGERAADLTRQLLLFSRQQVVQPKVFAPNELILDIDKMLQRLLGEDIELRVLPAVDIGRIRADPGSIEQVIVNLVVNARDAMPTGGRLTVETANETLGEEFTRSHLGAKPGDYVRLSVSDTGEGMDKQTLARMFEPFFTTKEQGKGTGLGLSTVFGIVQQSGGTIWVYSEPGLGTTFKVYLPRVDAEADEVHAPEARGIAHGTETILLVEDEDAVREVARDILARHGYTVLTANSGNEALAMSAKYDAPIHLLLTDIVMPGLSGPATAAQLAVTRPAMKLLCMSGYTDDAAIRHGFIDAGFAYLQKPFTVTSLTREVRVVLEADVRETPHALPLLSA